MFINSLKWNTVDIYSEYLRLAKLAISGRNEDVIALLRRAAKRSISSRPEFSDQLRKSLTEIEGSYLRRSTAKKTDELAIDESFVYVTSDISGIKPVWPDDLANELLEIVQEYKHAGKLNEANISPTSSVLFIGPPGVGKSLAANWLHELLGRPLLTLNLATIMSSHLGKTGSNLSGIIEQVKNEEVILFIDEIDSVGKSRGDQGDIGELKRLVNILLQALDRWEGNALIVAATNHPELLDKALWRRFDRVIEFGLPSASEQSTFIATKFSSLSYTVSQDLVAILAQAFDQISFGETEVWINSCLRKSIIQKIELDSIIRNALPRLLKDKTTKEKIELATILSNQGTSQRKISDYLGLSRDTIRKYTSAKSKNSIGRKL